MSWWELTLLTIAGYIAIGIFNYVVVLMLRLIRGTGMPSLDEAMEIAPVLILSGPFFYLVYAFFFVHDHLDAIDQWLRDPPKRRMSKEERDFHV